MFGLNHRCPRYLATRLCVISPNIDAVENNCSQVAFACNDSLSLRIHRFPNQNTVSHYLKANDSLTTNNQRTRDLPSETCPAMEWVSVFEWPAAADHLRRVRSRQKKFKSSEGHCTYHSLTRVRAFGPAHVYFYGK